MNYPQEWEQLADYIEHMAYTCDVLMQFTGLKDRTGREIYEGDILKTSGVDNVKVVWNNDDGRWDCKYIKYGDRCELNSSVKYTSEVIGNIYENSELLK